MTASVIDPKSISSKIKLVKKAGPGELKGVVELELSGGSVTFTGLQIDQPGSYIIEAIPSSPDLEKTEFTIEVQPEPQNIEQPAKAEEEKKEGGGERPIIAQIDEPNVKLEPIKRPVPQSTGDTIAQASSVGVKPVLVYGKQEVATHVDIKSLLLYYEENIPKCKVEFRDSLGMLRDQPPRDDSKFELFLNSTDKDIKCIHLAFKIKNHKQLGPNWQLDGSIQVDDLYVPSSKSYEGTSFEVLRKITKELNLGFNSNIDNTDDSMKWININKDYRYFIKDIIDHSYKDEKSFMYGYIDFYYAFNYVDIEKEWQRATNQDFMVETSGNGKFGKGKGNEKFVPLKLTNESSEKDSVGYFTEFKILNQSTQVKIDNGYKSVTRYYDEEKKAFLEFKVDSQSTDNGKNLILKGEQSTNEFSDKKVSNTFLGKMDTDNVHKNYNYAQTQNRINLDNLTSISCTVTLPNPNFNLYRLQKVYMMFRILDSSPTKNHQIDFRYTGDWIIIDINYEYTTSTRGTKFLQKLTLVRKELGKNPEELKDTPPPPAEKKEGNKNENPQQKSEEPKPNARYKVGDKVQVIKNDGSKYEIEITKILENGNEVEGKIKKI